MKVIATLTLILYFCQASNSQYGWIRYNDSSLKATKDYYSGCEGLSSNKLINAKKVKIDLGLIRLLNLVYNDSTFTLSSLLGQTNYLRNRGVYVKSDSIKTILQFDANAKGNLQVTIWAELENDTLRRKAFYLATKTSVICDKNSEYVDFNDFVYFERLIKSIYFPLRLKPGQNIISLEGGKEHPSDGP